MTRHGKARAGKDTARELGDDMQAAQKGLTDSSSVDGKALTGEIQRWQGVVEELGQSAAQEADLALLYELTQKMNASLDLTEMLNLVMDSLVCLTGAERGCLMLLDNQGNLHIRAARHLDQEDLNASAPGISHEVVQEAMERKEAVLTTSAQLEPVVSDQDSRGGEQLRSILCVPLHARDRALGALYLDNRCQKGAFSEKDLPVVTALAEQAAMAIENAPRYVRMDKAPRTRIEELTTPQRIDRELNARLGLDRFLEQTLRWALQATTAEAGVLSILDADDDMQVVTVSKDGMAAAATGADEMTQVMESAESAIVGEGRILVPIRLEGRAIGVLDLQSNGVAQFEQQHAHFASRLADHAAIAIENARLYERIDRANEATSQFVSQVTHKLRTPLTSIRGYAGLLGNERVGSLTPKQKAFAEAIERNVDWMEVLVCDLQDISQIEAGEFRLRREAVPLISALKEAFQATEGQMEARSHEVRWDIPGDLPAVLADPASLTKIFANLLSNACKYTPDGGHIDVRAQCSEGSVQCTVTDDGIGISPEDQAQVFTKFFRSEDAAVRGMPGTGLGLSIVKHLVEMHGGETTVESQPGRGTAVTFTLPVARIG